MIISLAVALVPLASIDLFSSMLHCMPGQFQPRLLHTKVDPYPGIPLVKLKPVNLLACMTGMIYANCRKPSPTFLESWLSDFPIRHHIFQLL